jgi:hypothetical protein
MMAAKLKRGERLKARSALLFDWHPAPSPLGPKLVALGITAGIFSLLMFNVRVRVVTPGLITGRHASLMLLPGTGAGNEWALKAREGGPFPSRFEPGDWPPVLQIEREMLASLRLPAVPYQPALRDPPSGEPVPSLPLATKGVRVFPPVRKSSRPVAEMPPSRLMPALYPLSGLEAAELPDDLPPFPGEVTVATASMPWRFLIRLLPGGGVADCTSLAGMEAPGVAEIQAWLKQVQFRPETAGKSPWIAVAVHFTNQRTDGTDAR